MIQPVNQYVLVKPFSRPNISEGGLFVPDTISKESNRVEIVKVGNGTPKSPMRLKEGQVGFRVRDWGEQILVNGEKHYLMTQQSIIALE